MANLDRRSFLGTLSAGLAVSASAETTTIDKNALKFRLGLVTYNVAANWELPTLLKVCKTAGISPVELRTTQTGVGTLTTSSGRENGWTAGASIEYAVWDHVILGVAYDYMQFNADRPQISTPVGPVLATHASSGVDIQTVTARLSFKFGGGAHP